MGRRRRSGARPLPGPDDPGHVARPLAALAHRRPSSPTIDRTIWWQKAEARMSKRSTPSPRSTQPASSTRRTSDASGTGPAAEGGEVVLADERVAGQLHAPQVERRLDVPRRAGQERVGHRPVQHRVAVGPPRGRVPGVEVGRPAADARGRRSPGASILLSDRCRAHRSTSAGVPAASKVTTWPQACTPASVRPAQVSSIGMAEHLGDGGDRGRRRPSSPLPLRGEAAEAACRRRRPASGRETTAPPEPSSALPDRRGSRLQRYTSSMRAMGALSPWRGPSLRMRV